MLTKSAKQISEPTLDRYITFVLYYMCEQRENRMYEVEFVVLSHFTKKGNKAPPREISKAKTRRKDHIERHGG